MKITVINGNMRHGSTWNAMRAVIDALHGSNEVTEFFLPRDMPHFCIGCFTCITKNAALCPHVSSVAPIAAAILDADLIVLTSPVYAMDISGQMKALLDHLCYLWMSHRPEARMFGKLGLVVSTTAGAGLGHAGKTMKNSLKYWGVKKIYTLKTPVSAMKWEEVKSKKQDQVKAQGAKLARQIEKAARDVKRLPNPIFRSFFFKLMTGMMKKNDWNLTDRTHWESNGWLSGAKPF
jgi:multimeric flavodoxin WrbA